MTQISKANIPRVGISTVQHLLLKNCATVDPFTTDFIWYYYTSPEYSWQFFRSKMIFMNLVTLLIALWFQSFPGYGYSLPDLLANPTEQAYFAKYGPCSISASRLNDAYFVERKLAATILKGLSNLDNKRNEIDFSEKDEELKKAMQHIIEARNKEIYSNNFTNNPINVLNFMTRIVTYFNPVLDSIFTSATLMKRSFHKDLSALVDRYIREECSCWPTAEDISLVVKSISRISSTYNLLKKNMSEGYIFGDLSLEPLRLDQAIALSQEANRNNYLDDVLDWTEYLLRGGNVTIDKDRLSWQSLVRIKATALFKKDHVKEAITILEDAIKEAGSDSKLLKRDLDFFKSKGDHVLTDLDRRSAEKTKHYTDLCRQEEKLNKDNGMRCYYQQIGTLWDRIKIEMLSKNPPAFKYHRIIKEEEILHLFDLMKTLKIKMSAYNEKESIISDAKLAREIAVVWDDDHYVTKGLSRRIAYVTGLDVKSYKHSSKLSSSSPFQIINYGTGGYVEPHTDYLALGEDDNRKDISAFGGDRMATWMYQLSDKVKGGQIVFPKSNVTVSLERGSGILLFNIFKNGTINPSSEYMECPVILGSKWIATKYIHENGNMFKRKCATQKKSFF